MKSAINISNGFSSALRGLVLLALVLLVTGCPNDIIPWEPDSDSMVITEYVYNLAEEEGDFGEFSKAMEITGIENLLRVRGPFTLMLPTDEAMQEYYTELNVSSIEEIDEGVLETFVYNHMFQGEISIGSIGLGTLLYKNALGDFVASDLPGIEILLNKEAIIIKRDIRVSNGYVHHIDNVIHPVVDNIYDVVANDGGYEIFTAGLDASGLADTLKIIEFPFGTTTARSRYTLLAVPDTLYNRVGINSVDDLITEYDKDGNLTDHKNGFFQYMEYHCLSGTHYFSDFTPDDIYYLVTDENYLNIKVEDDWKINKTDSSYTGFYYDQSNIPAKNGAIHTINTTLPVAETALSTVRFEVTHFFDMQQGPYYLNYYERFYDGENTFQDLKWGGEYLMYYLKPGHNLIDDDGLNLNGHFWVEVRTPKIRKGKYDLAAYGFLGNYAISSVHLDGEYFGIFDPSEGSWGGDPVIIGEIEFFETKQHTFKLTTLVPGQLFWDYIIFYPK
jgi:uncharacterized surface protein with fasciclin (FAS1) repeats